MGIVEHIRVAVNSPYSYWIVERGKWPGDLFLILISWYDSEAHTHRKLTLQIIYVFFSLDKIKVLCLPCYYKDMASQKCFLPIEVMFCWSTEINFFVPWSHEIIHAGWDSKLLCALTSHPHDNISNRMGQNYFAPVVECQPRFNAQVPGPHNIVPRSQPRMNSLFIVMWQLMVIPSCSNISQNNLEPCDLF